MKSIWSVLCANEEKRSPYEKQSEWAFCASSERRNRVHPFLFVYTLPLDCPPRTRIIASVSSVGWRAAEKVAPPPKATKEDPAAVFANVIVIVNTGRTAKKEEEKEETHIHKQRKKEQRASLAAIHSEVTDVVGAFTGFVLLRKVRYHLSCVLELV